jgi:8-oxo-dGTP pyrophosphatase MutT (NUDIX family)
MTGEPVGDDSLSRHVRACRNAVLPGQRVAFLVGDAPVGWVLPDLRSALLRHPAIRPDGEAVRLDDPRQLEGLARAVADGGFCRWRDEAFDVRANPDGPALARIDRGALPAFGIAAQGVHVNGVVRRADGLHLWVARRAADKKLDPGKLDHVVAGGVPAGFSPAQTLVKEAAEEAGIPAQLAATATFAGTISYAMERAEGLRRDRLHCCDLDLPERFLPIPTDGEVEAFELWPVARVIEAVRRTDRFKFNVNLVLIDFFIRRGLLPDGEAHALREQLDAPG